MPEVTITLPDPAKTAALLKDAAAAAGSGGCNHTAGMHARWLADQIEEQVKPAIDEPTEFGSLIRAAAPHHYRALWTPSPTSGDHYWMSEKGVVEVWPELTDVEVLRVGLGDVDSDAYARGYEEGVQSNLPSPVDRSVIHSAVLEELDQTAGGITDAVMKALS